MNHIYVITTKIYKQQNIYKVGKHSGNKEKLIKRYITALPNIEIIYFQECPLYDIVETNIKVELEQYRIKNCNGGLSEWVQMPLHKLKNIVDKQIILYNNKQQFKNKYPNTNIHPLFMILDFLQ
jgi:hypothetical protein